MSKAGRKLTPRDDRVTINHEFASVEEFVTEYVTNISRTGVFIKTKHPLDVGTKVNLKFTVIMDDLETLEGIGEVVRVSANPSGMGVVFVTLTSHSHELIHKLITRRRAPRAETAPGVGGKPMPPAVPRTTGPVSTPSPRVSQSLKPPPLPADAIMNKKKDPSSKS